MSAIESRAGKGDVAGFAGRVAAYAILGGLFITAVEFAGTRAALSLSWTEHALWTARLARHWCLAAIPLALALAMLEGLAKGGAATARGYAAAILTGAAAGAIVLTLHGRFVDPAIGQSVLGFDMEIPDRFLYALWMLSFWGTAGAVLHASTLRQKRSAAAFRAAELARLGRQQRLAKATLEALHAEIEPDFLLSTLTAVERLYEEDRAAADQMLDALIRFLRLATPQFRQQRVTAGEEGRLLESYLRAVWAESQSGIRTQVAIDPAVEGAAIPSGLLLSVVQHLLGAVPAQSHAVSIALRAGSEDAQVRIGLCVTGAGRWDAAGRLAFATQIEQRLMRSCGPRTTFETVRDDTQQWELHITLTGHREIRHEEESHAE